MFALLLTLALANPFVDLEPLQGTWASGSSTIAVKEDKLTARAGADDFAGFLIVAKDRLQPCRFAWLPTYPNELAK